MGHNSYMQGKKVVIITIIRTVHPKKTKHKRIEEASSSSNAKMSQCIVPNWDVKQDHHEGGGEDQNNKISSSHHHHHHHHHHHQNNNLIACTTTTGAHHLVPMSTNYEVQELTWENGQLAMHGLSGLLNSGPTTKPTWGRAGDTLESIVHQATCHNQPHDHHQQTPAAGHIASTDTSTVPSSERKWMADDHHHQHQQLMKKRPSSDHSIRNDQDDHQQQILMDGSGFASASANATFCRKNNNKNNNTSVTRTWATNSMDSLKKKKGDEDSMGNYNDTTMMTWPSFESPSSFKTKATDDDSIFRYGSENQDEDGETKAETLRSHSSRRTRAAAVHNQSERRRRDRINQKMKSLQKLVPNASKTDKASMLDEVIEYLKQLQAQIQMMANMRNLNLAQMMGMQQQQQQQQQQQLQMSLLSRMGMGAVGLGMGMGMLHPQSLPPHHLHPPVPLPPFVPPPPFMLPPSFVPQTHAPAPPSPETTGRNNGAVPMADPYSAFLAQSMNMDLYNKMVAVYRQQQVTQSTQATGCPSKSNQVQGD